MPLPFVKATVSSPPVLSKKIEQKMNSNGVETLNIEACSISSPSAVPEKVVALPVELIYFIARQIEKSDDYLTLLAFQSSAKWIRQYFSPEELFCNRLFALLQSNSKVFIDKIKQYPTYTLKLRQIVDSSSTKSSIFQKAIKILATFYSDKALLWHLPADIPIKCAQLEGADWWHFAHIILRHGQNKEELLYDYFGIHDNLRTEDIGEPIIPTHQHKPDTLKKLKCDLVKPDEMYRLERIALCFPVDSKIYSMTYGRLEEKYQTIANHHINRRRPIEDLQAKLLALLIKTNRQAVLVEIVQKYPTAINLIYQNRCSFFSLLWINGDNGALAAYLADLLNSQQKLSDDDLLWLLTAIIEKNKLNMIDGLADYFPQLVRNQWRQSKSNEGMLLDVTVKIDGVLKPYFHAVEKAATVFDQFPAIFDRLINKVTFEEALQSVVLKEAKERALIAASWSGQLALVGILLDQGVSATNRYTLIDESFQLSLGDMDAFMAAASQGHKVLLQFLKIRSINF